MRGHARRILFTIEIRFESVASNYKLVARSFCRCERSFDQYKLNVTGMGRLAVPRM